MTHTDVQSSPSNFDDVGNFHEKFDLPTSFDLEDEPGPREYDRGLMKFRARFLLEELQEFLEAAGLEIGWNSVQQKFTVLDWGPRPIDEAKMFDALLDLTYVAMGTAHMRGYPWQEGWRRVQEANMTKIRAQKDGSDSLRGSAFDVVKPEGFIPPDIEGLLRDYGW